MSACVFKVYFVLCSVFRRQAVGGKYTKIYREAGLVSSFSQPSQADGFPEATN